MEQECGGGTEEFWENRTTRAHSSFTFNTLHTIYINNVETFIYILHKYARTSFTFTLHTLCIYYILTLHSARNNITHAVETQVLIFRPF